MEGKKRHCSICNVTKTKNWFRYTNKKYICRSCYYQKFYFEITKPRKNKVIRKEKKISEIPCANCGTNSSPKFRRNKNKEIECNACSIYYMRHNKPRPFKLLNEKKDRTITNSYEPII
uniref:GATA-type domain-containing protein n=1 Tax=Meloidogyne incognita TaxID=6306 RepID=A0A914LBR3_MELIC